MGGYYSGRWHGYAKKNTVEDSLTIDLTRLYKTGWLPRDALKQRIIASGNLAWYNTRTNDKIANIDVRIDTTGDNPHMRLIYKTTMQNGQSIFTDEMVRLSYTPLHFGSRRVWLHCPQCDKRVRTLHNPPGAIRFLCRDCYDLSYMSAQEAHKHDRGRYAAFSILWTLEDDYQRTYEQLRKTRGNSKAKRRLSAKLDRMNQDMDSYLTRAEQSRLNALSDFGKLLDEMD